MWDNIDIDINATRQQSLDSLRKTFDYALDILEQLLDEPEYDSLARFGEIGEIKKEMNYLLEKSRETSMQNAEEADIVGDGINGLDDGSGRSKNSSVVGMSWNGSSNEAIDYSGNQSCGAVQRSHSNYYKLHQDAGEAVVVDFSDVKPGETSSLAGRKSSRTIMSPLAKRRKEKQAKVAEKEVLAKLGQLGYTDTEWMSAYAKEDGVNLNGGDGYGYDIRARKDGKIRYIEVKSSGLVSGIRFEMSDNEFIFCDKHPDKYDIAYVYAMNTNEHKIVMIENVREKLSDGNMMPNSYKVTLK